MAEDTRQIRSEIEETRERMGETVDALAHKANVPGRMRESVAEKTERFRSQMSGTASRVSEATPDTGDVKHGARQAAGVAQENPIGLGIGAAAAGFLLGLMIPSSRVEDERLGPTADQVKDRARETGQEALERGREVGQEALERGKEAAQDVAETAKESGRQHAEELRTSAKDKAVQTKGEVRSMADTIPAGSDVSAGTYRCTECHETITTGSVKSLPPCPKCANGSWEALTGGDAAADPYPGN